MPADGGVPDARVPDAASGDAGTYTNVMDASTSAPDAAVISELPPTPVDDAGQPIPDAGPQLADAGTIAPVLDAGTDAGMVVPDAGMVVPDAGMVAPDAGMDAGAPSPCLAGRELAGYCWFLGAVNQSCNRVCAAHGGYVPSLPYLGSRAQGGALSRCDAVLTLLTAEGDTTSGLREDGRGVGCHLFEGVRWWLYTPNFSPSAYHWKAQLACSCLDK